MRIPYGLVALALLSSQAALAREYADLFATPKALSMGGAVSAIADDYTALQYNPAGLALVKRWQLRAPDLVLAQASKGIKDFKDAIDAAKDNSAEPIAKQLQRFDGKNASLGFDLLGFAYLRKNFGAAINPLSLNTSFRVRTPSLLFVKAKVRVISDTGVAVGFAKSFYSNHLRVGVTLRPFIWRSGFEQKLENQSLTGVFEPQTSLKQYVGSGWGSDADVGVQGNLNTWTIAKAKVKPMAGLVVQNLNATKFSQKMNEKEFLGVVPGLERRMNVGIGGTIENWGVFRPTLTFELRDLFIQTHKFMEHISSGLELMLKPKRWLSTAFRLHFYKGNIGGGVGAVMGPAELELGTYAVNLGNGPGIGVNRRYYAQLSAVF